MHDNNRNGVALAELPDMATTSPDQWRAFSQHLLQTIEQQREEIAMLREQRCQLLNALVPNRHKKYDLNDDAILSSLGAKPTIQELIAELK